MLPVSSSDQSRRSLEGSGHIPTILSNLPNSSQDRDPRSGSEFFHAIRGSVPAQTLGNLEPDDHVVIENILAQKGIFAPIVTEGYLDPEVYDVVSRFDAIARDIVATWKARFSIEQRVCFFFVASTATNAFAARSSQKEDTYYIGILVGAVLAGRHVRDLLTNVETRKLLGLPESVSDELDPNFVHNHAALAGLAFYWLIYHELGHIKNGHLHLKIGATFNAISTESNEQTNLFDQNRTRHTLEMDADCFASGEVMFRILRFDPASNPNVTIYPTAKSRATAFFMCAYALMRAFDPPSSSFDNLFSSTHPPAFLRVGDNIANWGFEWFKKNSEFGIDPREWLESSVECVIAAEVALYPDKEHLRKVLKYLESGRSNYGGQLLSRWAAIRPDLEKHVLGTGKLAPAQKAPE